MRRPTVVHHVEQWGAPSERFVVDTVRSMTATRAVVVAGRTVGAAPPAPAGGRLVDLSRLPKVPVHAALAGVAVIERAAGLHAHFALAAGPVWRAARRLGRPFVVSAHGWDVLVAAKRDPGMAEALRAATAVVVPSSFLRDAVLSLGVAPERIRVIPSGVDLAELPFRSRTAPAGPAVVTYAGRFAEKKGVLDVARAVADVAREVPLRARFVGLGPLEPQLRECLSAAEVDAEIVDGSRPGAVRRALAETDVFVTGSRTAADGDAESLGLVNIEAQACGVPLVTTRHGGIPEAVSADAAVFIDESGDIAQGLADGLRTLLADPKRWAAMGRAGREHVAANFELSARTADLEELWAAIVDGARDADIPTAPTAVASPRRTSVVLVTHNRSALLTRTLDALEAQTRAPDEIVVVDNGSTDETAELLAARDNERLRVLTRPANLPVAAGRNLAVGAATGDVIAFTDDDCRPRPTWLEVLLAGMRDGVGLVQGRTQADPGQPLVPLSRTQWTPAEFGLYETCNIAYDRQALSAVAAPPDGPFDLEFADDVAAAVDPSVRHQPFGEDTDLGWRVKRTGVRSRFATHAVVDHEVWPPDPDLLRRRATLAAAFPVLVRRVPELRDRFLWHRYVLGPHRARLWLALGGVATAAATGRRAPLLLAAPYADDVLGLRRIRQPGRRTRLRAAPTVVRTDAIETVALLRGSLRTRTPVL